MILLLLPLAFFLVLGKETATDKDNVAIIFPPLNVLPSKIPLSDKASVNFPKAIRTIHYAAERLLQLTKEDTRVNWVVCPVSLAAVLGQLMLGAKGDFHRILGEILSPGKNGTGILPGLDVHKELGNLLDLLQDDMWADYLLTISSALFLHPEIQLKLSYKHALADIYRVNIFRTDFSGSPESSTSKVNAWVQKMTMGRVTEILAQPVSPNTASLYINTVYFKAAWKLPFDITLTKPGLFSLNKTHQVPVDFMAGEIEVRYIEEEACKCSMLGIPYKGANVFLYIFLQDKTASGSHYQLFDFASYLTIDRMTNMIDNSDLHNLTVILPKINLTSTMSLRKPMVRAITQRQIPLRASNSIRDSRDIAEQEEELSNFLSNSYVPKPLPLKIDSSEKYRLTFNMGSASEDYRFKIDDVLHKVQLEMNEEGSEAVAVSATLVDYFGGQIVKVDRPFIFLIRHEYTGAHLFWGALYSPLNQGFDASKSTKGASKLRRDLINAEIANLRDLLPLPPSTRQRLSQLQLMALVCVYVRKANYFQQVFKRHDVGHHQVPTPNIGFSKALNGFLMMMTQNGKLLYISDNAAEYLGHSMEDLLIHGDSVYDIIDKQDHPAIQTELMRNAATPTDDDRMFLCRMNVSRNARRQMRFGDQKVVLVQGHYLSFLPLCSRNEPVFLANCTPVAMPETRECVVQGATNVFTSIHSMDMKFIHIDKNGEFHLGFPRPELQGASWYQLLHWECMREAQNKHRLITQSEQDRSCILLLRMQKRCGDWLWVHCVLQVKDNMENSQQPVIVCTSQVLSDREATVMRTNSWLYHYYMVQSKLQYGLAYEAAAATRMAAAAAYYHPHPQHSPAMSPYSHHISHQHLDPAHHQYLQHQIPPSIQHLHSHNGATPTHQHLHLSPTEPNAASPTYAMPHDSTFRYDRRLDPEPVPVDYSVHSHSDHMEHYQEQINEEVRASPGHGHHKRKCVKLENKSEHSSRMSPMSEVGVEMERGGGGMYAGGGGPLLLAATPVPLHSFPRSRVLLKGGMVDPTELMEQWNPSPPWSDTTVQKVPDITHQDLSPYVTTTPPTPTGTPSSLAVGSLSHQPPHTAFTFDWAAEQYVPSLQHAKVVCLADEEQGLSPGWPVEHRLFPLQPPPPPRMLQPAPLVPLVKMEQDASEPPPRKDGGRDHSGQL